MVKSGYEGAAHIGKLAVPWEFNDAHTVVDSGGRVPFQFSWIEACSFLPNRQNNRCQADFSRVTTWVCWAFSSVSTANCVIVLSAEITAPGGTSCRRKESSSTSRPKLWTRTRELPCSTSANASAGTRAI